MRVDGSLMGMDDKRTSLLPQWKRGHFSLLFDGATTPATILLCDHAKRKYLDLSKEKKKHKPSLDDEVLWPHLFSLRLGKWRDHEPAALCVRHRNEWHKLGHCKCIKDAVQSLPSCIQGI